MIWDQKQTTCNPGAMSEIKLKIKGGTNEAAMMKYITQKQKLFSIHRNYPVALTWIITHCGNNMHKSNSDKILAGLLDKDQRQPNLASIPHMCTHTQSQCTHTQSQRSCISSEALRYRRPHRENFRKGLNMKWCNLSDTSFNRCDWRR